MFGTILKATNSSFKKGMTYCRSIYVTKVMKLLAFIFEQPSYTKHLIGAYLASIIVDQKYCTLLYDPRNSFPYPVDMPRGLIC